VYKVRPLQVAGDEPQVPLERRQRDVDDRGIENHHELGDRDDSQHDP
jgi:hypothetical protein